MSVIGKRVDRAFAYAHLPTSTNYTQFVGHIQARAPSEKSVFAGDVQPTPL